MPNKLVKKDQVVDLKAIFGDGLTDYLAKNLDSENMKDKSISLLKSW